MTARPLGGCPELRQKVFAGAERKWRCPGRGSTLSTVQVDFHQPEQFNLRYVGADGARHRPVMIHRSVIGSVERAVAHLVERHGGAFPGWLAPTQLMVLPVSGAELPQARALVERCAARGLRAAVSGPEQGTLGARVRAARLVPYQAVIGAREAAGDRVALRLRDGRRVDGLPAAELLDRVGALAGAHSTRLWDEGKARDEDREGPQGAGGHG